MNATSKKKKKDEEEWEIEAVLEDDLTATSVPLVSAVVAVIEDKKVISETVALLGKILPLPSHQLFLKRVRTCSKSATIIVSLDLGLTECQVKLEPFQLKSVQRQLRLEQVPGSCPRTRQQFEIAREHWPCHFHEDKRLQGKLKRTLPEIWSKDKHSLHSIHMESAIELLDSSSISAAAVCVDPQNKNFVVATSYETVAKHKLRHAAMNVIDCVSHAHGGGAWPVMTGDVKVDPNEKAYLLTGYDVFLTHEPCIMCSMALVHSRVARIFFHKNAPSSGALQSVLKLQTVRDLNHSFEVYRMTRKTMSD